MGAPLLVSGPESEDPDELPGDPTAFPLRLVNMNPTMPMTTTVIMTPTMTKRELFDVEEEAVVAVVVLGVDVVVEDGVGVELVEVETAVKLDITETLL